MAVIAEPNRDRKKRAESFCADDFHPFRVLAKKERLSRDTSGFAFAKMLFVDRKGPPIMRGAKE
jgi:hypothetical protein